MSVIDSFNHNELGFKISNSQKGVPLLQQNPSKQYIDNTCACTMVSALRVVQNSQIGRVHMVLEMDMHGFMCNSQPPCGHNQETALNGE